MKLYAIRMFLGNWNESCDFYREKVALPGPIRDDSAGWAEYDRGGPCFGLQRVGEDGKEGEGLVGRFVGVSLHVEDIDASYRDQKARGVNFTVAPEKQALGSTLAFFKDPDGNVLTLFG